MAIATQNVHTKESTQMPNNTTETVYQLALDKLTHILITKPPKEQIKAIHAFIRLEEWKCFYEAASEGR